MKSDSTACGFRATQSISSGWNALNCHPNHTCADGPDSPLMISCVVLGAALSSASRFGKTQIKTSLGIIVAGQLKEWQHCYKTRVRTSFGGLKFGVVDIDQQLIKTRVHSTNVFTEKRSADDEPGWHCPYI
jgi:hypothetical protein